MARDRGRSPYASKTPPDSSVITDNSADIEAGLNYWKDNIYPAVGQSLSFTLSTGKEPNNNCSNVDVVIRTSVLTGAYQNAAGVASPSHGIEFNKTYFGGMSTGRKQELSGHEFGHVLGYGNVEDSSCLGSTIMTNGAWNNSLPSGALCGDLTAATTEFLGGNSEYDEAYEPSKDVEDCYDVYLITISYYFDGTQWHYGGTRWRWIDYYCGPPPI